MSEKLQAAIIQLSIEKEQDMDKQERSGQEFEIDARHATKCWGTKKDQQETDDEELW